MYSTKNHLKILLTIVLWFSLITSAFSQPVEIAKNESQRKEESAKPISTSENRINPKTKGDAQKAGYDISLVETKKQVTAQAEKPPTKNGETTKEIIAIISVLVAILAFSISILSWRVATKALNLQVLLNMGMEYRSPQMLYAIDKLWQLYKDHPTDFVKKYLEIRDEGQRCLASMDEEMKFENYRYTLHNQRRLISHFYQCLANLYVKKIFPKDILYRIWTEAELRIIPEILIPIEKKLQENLNEPPLKSFEENLLILYKDSKGR